MGSKIEARVRNSSDDIVESVVESFVKFLVALFLLVLVADPEFKSSSRVLLEESKSADLVLVRDLARDESEHKFLPDLANLIY